MTIQDWSESGIRTGNGGTTVFGDRDKKRTPPVWSMGGNAFIRLITAKAIAQLRHEPIAAVVERLWPMDLITRAASAPAMTTVAGWAAELARKVVAEGLAAMGPATAATQVLRQGLVLSWDGAGQISAPGIVAGAGNASFVQEGQPIPVRQLASATVFLNPFKLAAISVLTREMAESSNAEAIIRDALVNSMGPALGTVLFGSTAATSAQPAGLRAGIAAQTASVNTELYEAFFEDCDTLINAVSAVGGNGPFIFVARPGRAAVMIMRFVREAIVEGGGAEPAAVVYGSAAMGNDLMCIAPNALVSAFSPDPEVVISDSGTLHMESSPVLDLGSASPGRSLFQTESLALRVRWPVSFALRNPAGVAWLTPTWK